MTTKEIIAVVQAHERGETIQFLASQLQTPRWLDISRPTWDFSKYEYRVKPKPREFWVNIYHGYVSSHNSLEAADACKSVGLIKTIRVREVLE